MAWSIYDNDSYKELIPFLSVPKVYGEVYFFNPEHQETDEEYMARKRAEGRERNVIILKNKIAIYPKLYL